MFKSENELDKFIFDDCVVNNVILTDTEMIFELEALIVGERNSQNTNFTKSYADTAKMVLSDVEINSMVIAGYKVYDADDNLVETIDDKEILVDEYSKHFDAMKGAYLYRVLEDSSEDGKFTYDIEIESAYDNVQDLRSDTYVINASFSKSLISWDRYLNRVNN